MTVPTGTRRSAEEYAALTATTITVTERHGCRDRSRTSVPVGTQGAAEVTLMELGPRTPHVTTLYPPTHERRLLRGEAPIE